MKTQDYKTPELRALHALARYETHGGYVWAAVMEDGELLCTTCVRANFRQIYRATREGAPLVWCGGWRLTALDNSGDAEFTERCAHCDKILWDHE